MSLVEKVTNKKNEPKIEIDDVYEVEPVTVGGTQYKYDMNKRYWKVGSKKAPNDVQVLLSQFVSQSELDKMDAEGKEPTKVIQPKKKRPSKMNMKTAKMITNTGTLVNMVEKLWSINQTLLDDLNDGRENRSDSEADAREEAIEERAQPDARPVDADGNDIEEKESSGIGVWGAIGIGLFAAASLIFSKFEDISDFITDLAFPSLTEGVTGLFDSALNWIKSTVLGGTKEAPEASGTTMSAPRTRQVILGRRSTFFDSPEDNEDTEPVVVEEPDAEREPDLPPRDDIVGLARWLEENGFRVSENELIGEPVGNMHGPNSAHHTNDALDVNIGYGNVESENPEMAARMDWAADQMTAAGYNVIWRRRGHQGHIHVQTGEQGVIPGSFWKGGRNVEGPVPLSAPQQQNQDAEEDSSNSILENMAEILGAASNASDGEFIGSVDEMTENNIQDVGRMAVERYADNVDKTVEEEIEEATPQLPNLNEQSGGTVQTPPSTSDRNYVDEYLRYFGYNRRKINPLQRSS